MERVHEVRVKENTGPGLEEIEVYIISGLHEMGWNWMGWMGWDGMGWNRMGLDGMRWNEMEWDGMEWRWAYMERDGE